MTSPALRTDGSNIPAKIKIGTRGSELALIQTRRVIDALKKANPDAVFELVVIKSTGDKDRRLVDVDPILKDKNGHGQHPQWCWPFPFVDLADH